MKLVIKNKEFLLPENVEIAFQKNTNSTHLFFDNEDEYDAFLGNLLVKAKINRFGHGLGIVFAGGHIFWEGHDLPVAVQLIF